MSRSMDWHNSFWILKNTEMNDRITRTSSQGSATTEVIPPFSWEIKGIASSRAPRKDPNTTTLCRLHEGVQRLK